MRKSNSPNPPALEVIPTGIFIQSLQFTNANDIKITGYIWQQFNDYKAAKVIEQPQFIFPEMVSGSIEQQAAYK